MPVWLTKDMLVDIVVCLFFFSAGFWMSVKFTEAARAVQLEAEAKAQKEAQDAANEKAAEWEKTLTALRDENKHLSGRLKHETQNAIYSKCHVPDSGVRIYNDALSGKSGSLPSLTVP